MAVNPVTITPCEFRGQEFIVSVRQWEDQLFTLQWVCFAGHYSGTDFEHYVSFEEAYAAGVRLGRAAIAGLKSHLDRTGLEEEAPMVARNVQNVT